ncbi:MAG: 3-dehydroquinate synthase [Pseudomonadota bacterium]|nr:3-dehydroquinate synthase [Pseudomonadota bacterium]
MATATPKAPPTRRLEVELGDRSYPIYIGPGVLARTGGHIRKHLDGRRAIVVTNAVVSAHWLAPLQAALQESGIAAQCIEIRDGEAHKSWSTLHDVLTRMLTLEVDRSCVVIALGGGVVGDLAGFASAIYQRGIPFIQVPTTLLAQVDSSVGGKTGINHAMGKNMIGAFHQPAAVFVDTDCLRTLPGRELVAGLAEVIKHAAIRDASLFGWLEENIGFLLAGDSAALTHAIARSCEIKAAIVAGDERETGERALLNFGHTFGHAIETGVGYGQWLHGEAVAAGMLMAARLSVLRGFSAADSDRLRALIARAGLPVDPPALGRQRYLELMRRDKKVLAGTLRFILLRALGEAYVAADVSESDLEPIVS